MGRCQQRNECWDSASVYHSLGLFWCPRSNVSEGPSRFELNGTTISSSQEGHKFWNQASPDYVVNRGLFFPRKQFPSSLSSLELAFQIVAIYAFDNIINRPIYSALVVAVFLQWRSSIIKKGLTFLLFSVWSSFLAFLSPTLNSIRRHLISVLSFPLFLNLLRQGTGELAFSLVDMIMRQREKATQLAQVSTGGGVRCTSCGVCCL